MVKGSTAAFTAGPCKEEWQFMLKGQTQREDEGQGRGESSAHGPLSHYVVVR